TRHMRRIVAKARTLGGFSRHRDFSEELADVNGHELIVYHPWHRLEGIAMSIMQEKQITPRTFFASTACPAGGGAAPSPFAPALVGLVLRQAGPIVNDDRARPDSVLRRRQRPSAGTLRTLRREAVQIALHADLHL